MKNFVLLFLLVCFAVAEMQGQDPPSSKEEYEAAYKKRIQREILYGVYIPKDLTDAFIQLNQLIDEDSKKAFKNYPEEEAARQLFFSFGRWITHNWGFYGGSRLSHYLKELGIHHPEDMARFIIITYHRNLNRNSLNVKALVEQFQEARKQEAEEKRKDATILHEETRKRERDQ
jgi:hypothetical protein